MQTKDYPAVPDDFGHWLAGFIDGEGCFSIACIKRRPTTPPCYACRFDLRIRDDDAAIIEEIQARTGIGRTVRYKRPTSVRWNSKPVVLWHVLSRSDCEALMRLLDRCPLRAKKARDYAIWREALIVWASARRGNTATLGRNRAVWAEMARLKHELQSVRTYRSALGSS